MTNKRIAYTALLSALALIFGYIESLFPAFSAVPGIKLGLSNIVILFALYRLGAGGAVFVMLVKVTVSSLLFSGLNTFLYSLSGGILSVAVMVIFRKSTFGVVGISMLGAIFHNIGQLAAAAAVLKTVSVFCYMPVLALSGLLVGCVTGDVCKIILTRVKGIGL